MALMKSQRDFRLTSTKGHILQVVADEPINVPPKLEEDALAAGMIRVKATEVRTPDAPPKDPGRDAEFDNDSALEQALMIILTRNDPDDFKADGTPKVNRVNAELPIEASRATATEVSDKFQELQSNIDLAE